VHAEVGEEARVARHARRGALPRGEVVRHVNHEERRVDGAAGLNARAGLGG